MATETKQEYVCPVCERIVVPAQGESQVSRCEAGHPVRVLHARPLWLTGVLGFVGGYFVLSTVMHGINFFLQDTHPDSIKAVILAAAGVACAYLIVVGRDYAGRPDPMRSLGRQYIAIGTGALAGTLLASALAWMDLPT